MTQLQFINKIPFKQEQHKYLRYFLKAALCLYAALDLCVLFMEGIFWENIEGLIFAIIALFLLREKKYPKESECILTVYPKYMVCEYPQIRTKKESISLTYIIWEYMIDSIVLHEDSVVVHCHPIIEYRDSTGNEEVRDCSKTGEHVHLPLYYSNTPQKLYSLLEENLEV